jgi:hypothetical protein
VVLRLSPGRCLSRCLAQLGRRVLLFVIAWTRPYGQRWRVSTYRTQIGIRWGRDFECNFSPTTQSEGFQCPRFRRRRESGPFAAALVFAMPVYEATGRHRSSYRARRAGWPANIRKSHGDHDRSCLDISAKALPGAKGRIEDVGFPSLSPCVVRV